MTLEVYEIVGAWVAIFLTLCIFSFLYADNPAYKLAEHLFVGVSIGVAVAEQWYGTLKPNLVDALADPSKVDYWSGWVALVLVGLMFSRLSRTQGHLARIPIALMVSAFAAVKLTGEASGNLMVQVSDSMPSLAKIYQDTSPHWFWNWDQDGAGIFSAILLVAGLASCLVYFYFSVPHSGPLRYVSRFGVWILMISFGASFGYTVMGRISLAYGRVLTLVGKDRPAAEADLIHAPVASILSILLIIGIIVASRMMAPPLPPEGDLEG